MNALISAESTRTDLICNYQKLYDRRNPNLWLLCHESLKTAAKVHNFVENQVIRLTLFNKKTKTKIMD